MSRASPAAFALAVVLIRGTAASAETPQERRRRELMEEVGLERRPAPAPAVRAADPAAPDSAAAPAAGESAAPSSKASPRSAPSFRRTIHPALMQGCGGCHAAGGPAGTTRLLLTGDAAADHRVVLGFVDVGAPRASVLLAKAAGQAHGGGAPWPLEGGTATRAAAWILAGARLDSGPRAVAGPVPATPAEASPRTRPGPAPVHGGPDSAVTAAPSPPSAAKEANASTAAPPAPGAAAHALLLARCGTCHRAGLPAGATRFVLSGDADADLSGAASLVDRGAVERSPLLTKGAGDLHGGGAVLPAGSDGYQRLLAWTMTLVPVAAGAEVPTPARPGAEPSPSPVPAPVKSAGTAPAAPASPAAGAVPRGGLLLPYGFQLNGRFDVNYERRGFSTDPAASAATNALRSYHHFLFLSRQSPEERIGLSVELLGLLFWEANLRFRPRERWQLVIAAGKLVVPFGADPLTHQSYGGLAGFDQRLLPSIWSTEGAAAHLVAHWGALAVTDDLYVIRGYALRRGDGVLSLRADQSPDDDARLAVGTRVGVAWGPAAVWYSAMFNPLGYGRRLFMQAADVTLWRARQIPVLRYLSVGAGLLRADVSGGGVGADYYHFGSYFQLRIHPRDWIYVQYRQGVTTVDNRRGIFVDRTRLTSDDASAHNVGVVVRHGGLSAGVFWFVNLEAIEVANDLLRVGATYEF